LPLLAFWSPAKADHHSVSHAMLCCSPRQSHVARCKKL
jgi:hypothetical protein